MRFKLLRAKNFLRLGDVELPLDNQGLVLIQGETDATNASSNGAGKSSLLDALCWALWGETIRGLSGDQIINRAVGKACEASVTFEDEGTEYKVTRYRQADRKKPNDVELEIDGELQDGASVSSTNRRIESIIGLSFTTFKAMMPGCGLKAASLTDANIKQLLESLLQMDVIAKAQDITKDRLKKLKVYINEKIVSIDYLHIQLEESIRLKSTYNNGLASFEQDKAKDLAQIDSDLEEIAARCTIVKILEDRGLDANAEAALVKPKQVVQMTILDQAVEDLRSLVKTYSLASSSKKEEITQYETKISQYEKLDVKIGSLEGTCTLCQQVIGAAHKEHQRELLEDKLDILTADLIRASDELEELTIVYDETIYKVRSIKQEAERALGVLAKQQAALLKEVEKGLRATQELLSLKKKKTKLQDRGEDIKTRVSSFATLLKKEVDKAEQICDDLDHENELLKSLQEHLELLEFWVTGFSTKGLRSLMLRHVTPILNERAKYYCNILTAGEMKVSFSTERDLKSGKTREDFNIVVQQKDGCESYTGASAGEKSRADLVIAFALGDLAHLRAKKSIPFRFLDEPFEAVDEAGHESIVTLLEAQKTQYDTVYCITHKKSFQELFPKRVLVIKQDGVSRLDFGDNV